MPDPIDWGFALPFYLGAIFVGYVLGSFPTGPVLMRLFRLGDLRKIGSGNIGATNALRGGNRWVALGTLLGDSGKAALAVWLGDIYGPQMAILAATGACLGHLFPIWLNFKGGKGVSVYIGALAVLFYPLALLFCALWLAVATVSRYASLASLIATACMPFAALYFDEYLLFDLSLFFLVLVFWKHWENIQRLWQSRENKIG